MERIVFTTALAEGWRPIEPWLALHKSAEDGRRHEEMGFRDGRGTVIDQLAALVARRA